MAGWWRGLTLLLLLLYAVSLSVASDVDALQGFNQDLRSRKLLQAVAAPPTPVVTPPTPVVKPPTPVPTVPVPATVPTNAPTPAPNAPVPATVPTKPPAPAPPSSPTPVRTYLMWIGIGAFCLVLVSVAVFCLCRKFGQQRVRGAQRLPPLPRYH